MEVFGSWGSPNISFIDPVCCAFGVLSRPILNLTSGTISPRFSSEKFIVLVLMWRSLVLFKLPFVYGACQQLSLILLQADKSLSRVIC